MDFPIEKGIPITVRRGKRINSAVYLAIEANMKKMAKDESFFVPVQITPGIEKPTVGADNLEAWVRRIEKGMNLVLDPGIRARNPFTFTVSKLKDTEGKKTGIRIWKTN